MLILLLFLLLLVAYIVPLIIYKPKSKSLRDTKKMNTKEAAMSIKGTLLLGIILIIIFTLTVDADTFEIKDIWLYYLGLNKYGLDNYLLYQVISNNLVHINIIHLASNLFILMLLSAYERRVGTLRYFIVFSIAAIASSIIQSFFISYDFVTLGASAGIAGLVAGYFIDLPKVSFKEWLIGLVFIIVIVYVLSLSSEKDTGNVIDWIAHILGVISACIYFKVCGLKQGDKINSNLHL